MLRLANSQATFYYELMNSIEFAIKFTASALIQAKNGMAAFTRNSSVSKNDIEQSMSVLHVLEANLKRWRSELVKTKRASAPETHTFHTNTNMNTSKEKKSVLSSLK